MSATMAPNVSDVDTPGRRTVYSMCGMCAVRCPIEVTVEDGRVVWLQGNTHDKAIGASLCAKGSAGLALEQDDQRPQTPLIRKGPRGGGRPGTRRSTTLPIGCTRRLKLTAAAASCCPIAAAPSTT
jgi:thiosulfate reductase / polysulfide reductase chain A